MIGIEIALGDRRVVGQQLAPAERLVERRDDHDGGGAGALGVDAELDRLARGQRAGAGDDRHAAGGGFHGHLDHLRGARRS